MARQKTETINEDSNIVEKQVTEKEVAKKAPAKKSFSANDEILCRSVTQGVLFMDGDKTGMSYRWNDYGDETEVEYRDLVAAVRSKSRYIFNPYFIVEDQDFIDEFPLLAKFYKEQYSIKELRNILDEPNHKMIEIIKTLPNTAVESLKNIAAKQVANGAIDSVSKIKALDEIFGTELSLINQIFAN